MARAFVASCGHGERSMLWPRLDLREETSTRAFARMPTAKARAHAGH